MTFKIISIFGSVFVVIGGILFYGETVQVDTVLVFMEIKS